MKKLLVGLICVLCGLASAAPQSTQAPKALLDQVQRLTELLRDSYAAGYPDATMVQMLKAGEDDSLALVVFTIEGFGGGNAHRQYFAVFRRDTDFEGKRPHFTLIDVIPIGGKGWRGIQDLKAKILRTSEKGEIVFALEAFEVVDGDAPNFPSKKVTVSIVLTNGRLRELREP